MTPQPGGSPGGFARPNGLLMPEFLSVGETMLAFVPTSGSIGEAVNYRATVAGGESNVAVQVALHGRTAAWASRVGDDPAGRRILGELEARNVDTSLVAVDRDAPTGIMLKDVTADGSHVFYHRSGSAASRMAPGMISVSRLRGVRILHTTGVTAALSITSEQMVSKLFEDTRALSVTVAFDVNYRPSLWRNRDAAGVLLRLARASQVCFVGRDEAELLWGTVTAEQIRNLLPDPPILVVKDGPIGATAFQHSCAPVFEPAPRVEIVEETGAGDAFAGGFLAGVLADENTAARIRMGHAAAARVLRTRDDLPEVDTV